MSLLIAIAALAATEPTHLVRVELQDGPRLATNATLAITPGSAPTVMQVSGPEGYRLSVALESASTPAGHTVRLVYERPVDGEWVRVTNPVLTVGPNGPATVIVGREPDAIMSMKVTIN